MLTAPQVVLMFSAMTIALMGLLLVVLAKEHNKHVRGVSEWGAGLLLISGSIIALFLARHALNDIPKSLIGQTLVLIGTMMCASGLRRFFSQTLLHAKVISGALLAAFMTSAVWFSYIQPSFEIRSVIYVLAGFLIVLDMLVIAYKNRSHGIGVRLLGFALLMLLLLKATKLSVDIFNTQMLHIPIEASTTQLIIMMMPSVIVTMATLAFVLMGSEKLVHKLNEVIRHDDLTEALNKRSLYSEIAREIERSIRYKRPLSVMMIDLDNFKTVNDSLGHLNGDKILKDVVSEIINSVRGTDLVARFGGDEFAVLLTELDVEHSHIIANRILENLKKVLPEYCGTSIGISSLRSPGETVDSLLHRADNALYKAKLAGKNQFAVI